MPISSSDSEESKKSAKSLTGFSQLKKSVQDGNVQDFSNAILMGANPNLHFGPDGQTLLHEAAIMNQAHMIKLLIESGIDVNVTSNSGSKRTALHLAAALNNGTFCEALVNSGANLNALDVHKETPEKTAIRYASMHSLKVLKTCSQVLAAKQAIEGVAQKNGPTSEKSHVPKISMKSQKASSCK